MKRLSPGKRKHLIACVAKPVRYVSLDDPRVREAIREYAQAMRRESDLYAEAVRRNPLFQLMREAKA